MSAGEDARQILHELVLVVAGASTEAELHLGYDEIHLSLHDTSQVRDKILDATALSPLRAKLPHGRIAQALDEPRVEHPVHVLPLQCHLR